MRAAAITDVGIWITAAAIGIVTFASAVSVIDTFLDLILTPRNPLYVRNSDFR